MSTYFDMSPSDGSSSRLRAPSLLTTIFVISAIVLTAVVTHHVTLTTATPASSIVAMRRLTRRVSPSAAVSIVKSAAPKQSRHALAALLRDAAGRIAPAPAGRTKARYHNYDFPVSSCPGKLEKCIALTDDEDADPVARDFKDCVFCCERWYYEMEKRGGKYMKGVEGCGNNGDYWRDP